jgi:pimeloyl-ACP methyl ester carboxylesterase
MVASKLAAMAPDRVASLALLNTTGGGYQCIPKVGVVARQFRNTANHVTFFAILFNWFTKKLHLYETSVDWFTKKLDLSETSVLKPSTLVILHLLL